MTDGFYTRLATAQGEFTEPALDASNKYEDYRYSTLAAVIKAVRPALAKHGLALIQADVTPADVHDHVWVQTVIRSDDDAHDFGTVSVPVVGKALKGGGGYAQVDAKAVGMAITYAMKYGVSN